MTTYVIEVTGFNNPEEGRVNLCYLQLLATLKLKRALLSLLSYITRCQICRYGTLDSPKQKHNSFMEIIPKPNLTFEAIKLPPRPSN